MTKAKENKAEQVVVVEVTNTEVKLGRPVNESSRRQQILKLRIQKNPYLNQLYLKHRGIYMISIALITRTNLMRFLSFIIKLFD